MMQNLEYTKLKNCHDGLMLLHCNDTGISRLLDEEGIWAQEENQLLVKLIQPDSLVLDANAFLGTHALFLSRHLTHGRVFAFESQRTFFHMLCGTVALNSLNNVVCYPNHLGEVAGSVFYPDLQHERELDYETVGYTSRPISPTDYSSHVTSLDNLWLDKLDLLLMRPGSLSILLGGINTIGNHHPALYFGEPWQPTEMSEMLKWLSARDYAVYKHQYQVKSQSGSTRIGPTTNYVALWKGSKLFNDSHFRLFIESLYQLQMPK